VALTAAAGGPVVGLDATPLLGARTGIGRYASSLLAALAGRDDVRTVATAFSLRGRDRLPGVVPARTGVRSRPVPANLLQQLWMRLDTPPVELLCGRVDLFHGTNYVLPPLHRARGALTVFDLSYLHLPDTVQGPTHRLRTLVPRGLRRADVVITAAQAIADEVAEAYAVPADRLAVVPLGVDAGWSTAEPPDDDLRRGLGLPSTYLLAVGSTEPRKGLDTLLGALRQLPDAPPLALVGPPGWGPALDRAGLAPERVLQLGYQPEESLRSLVAGAACLAYPSRYEGFGLPPLEAMTAGVPVVTSDIAVCREVLGAHARYAPVGDADALAAALRATLADAGPTTASERRAWASAYTWEACAAGTLAAYTRALA